MITLIWPPQLELTDPWGYPPQGILQIARLLQKYEIPHKVLNLAGIEEWQQELKKTDTPFYGISFTTPMYGKAKAIITWLREHRPNAQIVVGGVHASVLPEETQKDLNPDFLVSGSAYELLSILGISDVAVKHPVLEIPYFEALDTHRFHKGTLHGGTEDQRSTTVITSSGCPFQCAYCCKYTKGVYRKSIPNIHQELTYLKYIHQVSHIRFIDDVLTLTQKHLDGLCKITTEMEMTWLSITRTDLINKANAEKMYAAGCREVCFGIESGDPGMLQRMRKKMDIQQAQQAIQIAKDAGLLVKVFLLFGFPGETTESVENTKKFIAEAKPDKYTLSTFVPLPGSHVFNQPDQYGITITNRKWEDYWFYWDVGSTDGYFIEYPNHSEIQRLRPELQTYLKEQTWR